MTVTKEMVMNEHYCAMAMSMLFVYYEIQERIAKNASERLSSEDGMYALTSLVNDAIADLETKLGVNYGGTY
jgi:hypothetical protein